MIDPKHLVMVARMLGGHGIQGFIKLKVFLETPQDLLALTPLVTQDQETNYDIKTLLERPKVILGRFKGITTRTQADDLKGVALYADSQEFIPPDLDSFYVKDVVGLPVLAQKNGPIIATVTDILSQKSGDILTLTTCTTQKEILLPFQKEFFPEVVLSTSKNKGFLVINSEYLHELVEG